MEDAVPLALHFSTYSPIIAFSTAWFPLLFYSLRRVLNSSNTTMKQIIVLQIQAPCSNFPRKVFKVAADVNGVESVAIEGEQRNKVVVSGERIDLMKLVAKLRKKVGCTDVISVTPINYH